MNCKLRIQCVFFVMSFLISFIAAAGEQMNTQEKLQLFFDEREISNLIFSFADALDTSDWQAYGETFTSDGSFTIFGQTRHGREAIMAGPARDLSRYDKVQHFSMNHRIQVNGDEATASSYGLAVHVPDDKRLDVHADVGIRYDYKVVRTEEGWRFAEAEITVLWTGETKFMLAEEK